MRTIKFFSMIFCLVTSMGFTSCGDDSGEPDGSYNVDELFEEFVGAWTFSRKVNVDDVTTEIQGNISYNADKTFKGTQYLYRNGILYLEEELHVIVS